MKLKKTMVAALLAGLTFLLSGCFVKTVDELYALPTHSDAYYDLQEAIDAVFASGSFRYSAPVEGVNRQSVQLADLDGDGTEEAIVYFKSQDQTPLCVYLFDRLGDVFQNVAVIQGTGSAFLSVEYAQLDGQGGLELLVGRQLSDRTWGAMNAYAMDGGVVREVLCANYSEYVLADLDLDDRQDLFLLCQNEAEAPPSAALYTWQNGALTLKNEASLSVGAGAVRRIVTGSLEGGVPAVFVASSYQGESLVTDVFALQGGQFVNICLDDSGVSAQTLRSQAVFADDMDADGVTELPQPQALPVQDGTEESAPIIRWYTLDVSGAPKVKTTTYHDQKGGWYVTLSEGLLEGLMIAPNESGTVCDFYRQDGGEKTPLFSVYRVSGEASALPAGRTLLLEQGGMTYSAQLYKAAGFTESELRQMFHLIEKDWNSGER